jgi:methionine-rich copper-binding protein CopC
MRKKLAVLALVTMVAAGATATSTSNLDMIHFGLAKSIPEADSSVPSPEAVQLWFTQIPQDNSVGIRLINPAGDLLETGPIMQDSEDQKRYSVQAKNKLTAGTYMIAWRGIGDDGHVVRDEFSFTVDAH